jgi:NAD(P)-dependent dehydrogenase (short-subunit alcohol dehydrogenase family)
VLESFRLDGKVAIVTGASSGLGVAFAQGPAQAGADVAICPRRADRLEATKDAFRKVIDVNPMGSYWMAQACTRAKTEGGSTVNIGSVLGSTTAGRLDQYPEGGR